MDFKGITWVGNVYQKFEAMCLEVEEIIVQDTVKYVENQVQTVGATVKKFCSDVVQDLLPESSVDSEKLLPPSMLHEYAPVCSLTKQREILNGEANDVQQERVTKDEAWVIGDQGKRDGCARKFRGLHADDYNLCTSPRQYNDSGLYRRTKLGQKQIFGRKQIFRKEKLPVVTRPDVKNDSSLTVVNIPHEKVRESSFHVETVSSNDSPAEVERFISREQSHKDDGNGYEHGLTAVGSIKSQDSEIEQSGTTSALALARPDDCANERDEEDSLDENRVPEQNTKIIQQLRQRPVEESCILVDRDEVHCVPPDNRHGKHKGYKKIRDAVYSRMRPAREQEYKRLAGQWRAEDAEFGPECVDNWKSLGFSKEENRASLHDTVESDWELL